MSYNRTVDIVVVGFGAAGAATALRAAELGASVVLVEKQSESHHTPNTRMSGGHVMIVNDVDGAARYLDRCAAGMIPLEITRAWAERAHHLVGWLDGLGTDLRLQRAYGPEHPEFEGAAAVDVYMQARLRDGTPIDFAESASSSAEARGVVQPRHPTLRSGPEFFTALASGVQRRSEIEVVWGSPAQRLLWDDGRVSGIAGESMRVGATHGVVLTTGGYEYDEYIKMNYLKASPFYFYSNPGNTGDGIRLAQSVGADLWHMNQMIGRAVGHFELPDGGELNLPLVVTGGGYVLLDRDGRRFANESLQAAGRHDFYYELLAYDSSRNRYPRIPCYWIFDATRLTMPLPSLLTGPTVVGMYDWSRDNQREIEQGWIMVGDTIEEVALKAGLDPVAVARSLREYNEICSTGEDPRGRVAASLLPIEKPPYCCVALYPGGPNTSGGPRRNEHAQVLDPYRQPIPGLFAAGELGQAIGMLYPAGGCSISEALSFGQVAAESALRSR